jgi:peroxiredoxin
MKFSLSIVLGFLILICSCTSNSDKNSRKFTLQGEINGQDTGIIVLSYSSDTTYIRDTTEIKNGKFVFSGRIFEPTNASLSDQNDNNRVFVFLEPQKMKISLSKDKYEECKMTGSKTQNDFDLLQKLVRPFYESISLLRVKSNNINDSIKDLKDCPAKISLEKRAQEIDKIWSETLKKIDSTEIKFVLDNPKSFIAIVYLDQLTANEVISIDSTKSIYNGLHNSFKQSVYGKDIVNVIRKKDNIRLGAQAPDFKAKDLNQQTVTLSQFKGKSVVLLDFWASWCVPCRESIPHLKTLHKKYHSKGFEVLAVSADEDRKAWIGAVNQDSTKMWYHIPYAEKWPCKQSQLTNDDIFQNYFVQAIPQQILIDTNGKIIIRSVGYSNENEVLLDKMLSEIFDN